MKKIKIIDLMNKIANGEEVPKKIKYKSIIYEYSDNDKFYYADGWSLYREFHLRGNCLNDEVEILDEMTPDESTNLRIESVEEEKKIPKIIPEALFEEYTNGAQVYQLYKTVREIIDYLKSKEKGE